MENVTLSDLRPESRKEALVFLKRLWNSEETPCPFCGNTLDLLHNKAKKSSCDWQCKRCGKVFRTISLLYELNEQMPD